MGKDTVKASWDLRTTKVFLDLCIELVQQEERKGTSLTKKAWDILGDKFTTKTGRVYEKSQFKNKYDSLRKEWQTWDRLFHETGLGWDTERNTVNATDDWWEKKIKEVPNYEKFRERGLQFRDQLTQLFGSVAVTGPQAWAPSSMTLPSEGTPNEDLEEGSEDSDEILGAPTGISEEFNSVNFNENSGGSEGNTELRQDNSGGGTSRGGSRPSSSLGVRRKSEVMKKRTSPSMKIADALSKIAETNIFEAERGNEVISRVEARRLEEEARRLEEEARAYEVSIRGVLSHLKTVPEVISDPDFFRRCTQLLMERLEAREMYAALKDQKEQLLPILEYYARDL